MSQDETINGPYIIWLNYGYEGWKPYSHPDLNSALKSEKHGCQWALTKPVIYEVIENA